MENNRPLNIAYYLGQYYPIEINNKAWGEGFTEWHNVARARPLFWGHKQPKLPGKLGFYDLRYDQTIEEQIQYAYENYIDAFCYWHYWFGGKRLLNGPLERLLALSKGKIKIMLGWANESWTGVWHGAGNKILMKQTYSEQELEDHCTLLSSYFDNDIYLHYNGKPVFLVYKPRLIPNCKEYLDIFRNKIMKNIGREVYIIGDWSPGIHQRIERPKDFGLDAVVVTPVGILMNNILQYIYITIICATRKMGIGPEVRRYKSIQKTREIANLQIEGIVHQTIVTGWDNTPRAGRRGLVFKGYNAASFEKDVRSVYELENTNKTGLIFIKSFNEWAEGNVFEPKFKYTWTEADVLRKVIKELYE